MARNQRLAKKYSPKFTQDVLAEKCKKYYEKLTKAYGKSGVMNIVEFAQDKEVGLGFKLYPMQILIFKLFFNIPLSNKVEDNPIEIPDMFNETVLMVLSEVDAVNYLFSEKMINMNYDTISKLDSVIIEILFFIGRRGSKTTMVSIIYAYLVYLLLKLRNPHLYFRISYSDPIGLLVVSNTEDGALRQYASLKQILKSSKFIKPFIKGSSGKEYYIATPRFKELEDNGFPQELKGDIKIIASAATSKVRGTSLVAAGMDEFAHFGDSQVKNKQKPRDKEIYEALLPAVSGFVTPEGKPFGRSFVFTSPNGKKGESWLKYQSSFNRTDVLMIRTPSHYINRNLASEFIKKMWDESELSAKQEYFAEFVDNVGNYITNIHKLRAQVNKLWRNSLRNAKVKGKYNLSVDLAQSGDEVSFTITHKEKVRPKHVPLDPPMDYKGIDYNMYLSNKDVVVLDYYVKLTPEESGGVISHQLILETFRVLYKYYNITKTTIDQWNYQIYSELLVGAGIVPEDELLLFEATEKSNSEVAKTFKRLYSDGRLMMPEDVDHDSIGEGSTSLEEIIGLTEINKGRGIIKVMAVGSLAHDDFYSSFSRSCYMSEMSEESQTLIGSDMISDKDRVSSTNVDRKIEDIALAQVKAKKTLKPIKISKFKW